VWTRTVALVSEHPALVAVIAPDGVYACYRFTAKLREHTDLLQGCIARGSQGVEEAKPRARLGRSDRRLGHARLRDGQRYVSKGSKEREKYSDPDASWGHRSAVSTRKGGGFYGYRLHMAVCSKTDLPLAWPWRRGR
jgi:hypothetical protein